MDKMASTSHPVDADTPVSQPGSSTATNQSEASAADVDTADTSSNESAFLLSLSQPTSSDFARKRQVLKNPPPVGKRRARGLVGMVRLTLSLLSRPNV